MTWSIRLRTSSRALSVQIACYLELILKLLAVSCLTNSLGGFLDRSPLIAKFEISLEMGSSKLLLILMYCFIRSTCRRKAGRVTWHNVGSLYAGVDLRQLQIVPIVTVT